MSEYFIPSIVTVSGEQTVNVDLYSDEFVKKRVIYLTGEVNTAAARLITAELDYLDSRSDEDITLIINSPGGSVTDGMMIYDKIKTGIHCDVRTVATGMAASMGAFLLAAGTKGKRYATENAEIMIHQPLGGIQGQASDISIVADHIQHTKKKLASLLAVNCGRTLEEIMSDTDRDHWLTAAEALEYGIVDNVGYPE